MIISIKIILLCKFLVINIYLALFNYFFYHLNELNIEIVQIISLNDLFASIFYIYRTNYKKVIKYNINLIS
jgi:hypothetical protein